MYLKNIFLAVVVFFIFFSASSQSFTRQDTLRGSITPERAWWDLTHYDLKVEVNPDDKYISGNNTILYTVLEQNNSMQIDLQPPMKIDKIVQNGQELSFSSEGNAHFIQLKQHQIKGEEYEITLYFSGQPRTAINAPWDGGFSWDKDSNGKHFIATSNQGIGASIWWPNKDHYYDEPENGIEISVTVPKDLMAVSNGRLKSVEENSGTKTWQWEVVNPINNYGVNINIGDYVHFGETYKGEKDRKSVV